MMAVMLKRITGLVFLLGLVINSSFADEDTVSVLVGNEAILQCSMSSGCGPLHSVRWYRGDDRIALLAESAQLARPEGPMSDRIQLSLSVLSELRINPTVADDEDNYRCELTYITPSDNCDPVTVINLKTLMKPTSILIVDQAGNEVKQDSALGGLLENSEINIECRAKGGKPTPTLSWTVADDMIAGDQSVNGEGEEAITTNRLFLEVERQYQGRRLKCSASSEALKDPMFIDIQMDLILLPKTIDISGIEHHVVQGSKVTLECKTTGSRPPPAMTWYNGTDQLPSDQALTTTDLQSDGTYTTLSRLSFWATRWENGQIFTCEARQLAAPVEQDSAVLNATHLMDVHYPPVVSVRPNETIVNETADVLLFCDYEANPMKLVAVTWLLDNEKLDLLANPNHYEGGNIDEQALLIKNSSEEDIGNYLCHLENAVGGGTSDTSAFVDVYFKPDVELFIDVENYVIESENRNVTLECAVSRGNPTTLKAVNWFLHGEFLKQFPICNETNQGYPNIDMCSGVQPNKLLLEDVGRIFHGNYSCQGLNEAGWGPISNETELIVYYEPGPATLMFYPQNVIKGMSAKLVCFVSDSGRPQNINFEWYRGSQQMIEITTSEWLVETVGLESETNFTCRAGNEAGFGEPAMVYVEVSAPPAFITSLNTTTGIVFNSSDVSLQCRVECSPLCGVIWLKNGLPINSTGSSEEFYTIVNTPVAPDSRNNYFESTHSKLVFNMINWPEGILDRLSNKTNYTCVASDNGVGPSINSTTVFMVEYPPENMTVSNKVISVNEDHIPEKVLCGAKGKPEPTYMWVRYNTTKTKQSENGNRTTVPPSREVLSKGYALVLKRGVKRTESGDLVCEATNKHGTVAISTYLNVMYKPTCEIKQTEVQDEKVLLCTANGNPTEVSFDWILKDENDTIDESAIVSQESQSVLKLEMLPNKEGVRTVMCTANNTVGFSEPCMITIQGYLPWWRFWSRTALMVTVGICIILLLALLLCCIIMCICRRRRKAKYGSAIPEDGMCITPQNESSIVQAIVSQGIPGLSPRSCVPTTPIQYSEKTRLVPIQGQLILPQGKNISMPATNNNTGRLQADLSQLEASYQAGLQAKQLERSNLSLNNLCTDAKQIQSNLSYTSLARDAKMTNENVTKTDESCVNNNNDVSVSDNEISHSKHNIDLSAVSQKGPVVNSGNKWPLKPGVLVHVNSNHSLSPKRLGRLANKKNLTGESDDNQDGADNTDARHTDRNMSNLGILERDADISNYDSNITRHSNQNANFDKDKCKNIMKSKQKKRSKFTKLFKRFDVLRRGKALMSDEDECLSDSDRDGSKRVKRTKSNKRALSLVGFSHDDPNNSSERSKCGLRSCLEGSPIVVVPTEGVVSFRRPAKNPEEMQNNNPADNNVAVVNTGNTNNNCSDSLNDSNQSRGSTNSRKRKKPGDAPIIGAGNGEDTGIDNPGTYENLPFHGLQQVPNKPVQIIRPRVVRALIGQSSPKTAQSVLEKQLECNPSFAPRIVTCPPFAHNPPHISLSSLAKSNSSSINTLVPSASMQTLTQSLQDHRSLIEATNKSLQNFTTSATIGGYNSNLNEIGNEYDESEEDSDQKFHSLNLKKDNRQEPQFSSLKMLRKRKIDRPYPHHNTQKVDYILVKKDEIFKSRPGAKREIVYANFSGLLNSSLSNPEMMARDNSLIVESMNASYQNLTDSIQIYENSPVNLKKSDGRNKHDLKTPTPAPRNVKSPVRQVETLTRKSPTRKSPRDHVYANMASHIGLLTEGNIGIPVFDNSELENMNKSKNHKVTKSNSIKSDIVISNRERLSGFVPVSQSSKILSRSMERTNQLSEDRLTKHGQFTSLTLPKRTSKSGLLMDSDENEKPSNKINDIKENKIKSSKCTSRNSSFHDSTLLKKKMELCDKNMAFETPKSVKTVKNDSNKTSPSIVDATPKIKPFMINQHGYNSYLSGHTPYKYGANSKADSSFKAYNTPVKKMELKFGSDTEKVFESIDKSVEEKANKNVKKILEADHRANFLAASKVFENKINNQNLSKLPGKVVSKQSLIIQPDKAPLQIPKLLPKPIPKMNPAQQRAAVRRSQSSVSSKGAKYRQHLRETSSVYNGSLIQAKIRELNLRQNTNLVGYYPDSTQTHNQTHPSITKPVRLPLQKHHSFCYFQPIKNAKENEKEFTFLDKDDDSSDETMGPLVYKPHIKININDDNLTNHELETCRNTNQSMNRISNMSNGNVFRSDSLNINTLGESRPKTTNDISPEHRESLNRLHELLKRDSQRQRAKKTNVATYKVGAMAQHKYVPNINGNGLSMLQPKRLVYADLDLEIPNENNSTNKLTSNEQGRASYKNVQRTPYATLKFDDATV